VSVDLDRMLNLASDLVARAKKRGADVAECVVQDSAHLSAKVRLGEPELVEEAASRSAGMRLMPGHMGQLQTSCGMPGVQACAQLFPQGALTVMAMPLK